jgi:secondary thiamine-phosphate synthase enzyme
MGNKMNIYYDELDIISKGESDIVDITKDIQKFINKSKINNGIVCVFIPGSTGVITTIEYEPGLKEDFPNALNRIAPKNIDYKHHNTWHDDNGRSHVKASLMGPSLTLPIHEGNLIHGTWQQLVFIELDTQPRNRKIIIQIIGE